MARDRQIVALTDRVAALEARLERVTGQGPSRQSFLMLSSDLMEQGGYARRAQSPVSESLLETRPQ